MANTDPAAALVASQAQPISQRSDFGALEQQLTQTEIASKAVAAQAEATIKARWFMAMQRPRNWDQVRFNLLNHCKRSAFAKVAWYVKPIGEGVEGLSIRFVEQALREMGNVDPGQHTVYDDDRYRTIRVYVTDLEQNVSFSRDVTIDKTVERRSNRGREKTYGERKNAKGLTVYRVTATEDELLAKLGSAESKALRTLGLRILPADIKEECEAQIKATRSDDAKTIDPDKQKKDVLDAFGGLNVSPDDLAEYLGHSVDKASAKKLQSLRDIYTGIKEGELDWVELLDGVRAERAEVDSKIADVKKSAQAAKDLLNKKKPAAPKPKSDGVEPKTDAELFALDQEPEPGEEDLHSWPGVKLAAFLEAFKDAGHSAKERDAVVDRRFQGKKPKDLTDLERGELVAWAEGDADAELNMQAAKEARE